jgi:hypothetical protein
MRIIISYIPEASRRKNMWSVLLEKIIHLPLQDSKPCRPESRFMQLHLRIAVILSLRLCNNLESVQ